MRRLTAGMLAGALGAFAFTVALGAAAGTVPEAAMTGDVATVKSLLKSGADVNAALGDGVTGLHWAARQGHEELANTLIVAGANVKATTRFGAITPLHLAAERGAGAIVAALVKAGADANAATATGATPLMFAAGAGDVATMTALLDAGAEIEAKERDREHTPLLFAAAAGRLDAVKLLLAKGANKNAATKVIDLMALSANGENPEGRNLAAKPETAPRSAPRAAGRPRTPGLDRGYLINEQVHTQGGMTALLFAARQGYMDVATVLLDAGVDVNQRKKGDLVSAMLTATVNGHFDLAKMLLDKGADPNLAAENGVTPLYAAINLMWAPRAGYPQPRAHLNQNIGYLEFMKALLAKGADPNARVNKKVWYTSHNFDLSGIEETGSTAFWRAAYAADVDAMKLLMSYGADPHIPTVKPPERGEFGDAGRRVIVDVSGVPPVPVAGPGVPALLASAGVGYGEGFAGNSHRFAPGGMLAGVKFLIEVAGADPNGRDHEGNNAIHHAAARGDLEMIKYLVSKGTDPLAVNREGQTTVDMANGPVQRVQPWPDVIKYLEGLGAKNNHKCLSC
ncbi:MAG: ankyrin repeat domain-containing protein [Acidobacteria bacterium]|nr:ankyrin repeat domain-containing protein [Acidobacteriota bacterium]